jgi:predicted transposase/invertase (TIGR01784 family)
MRFLDPKNDYVFKRIFGSDRSHDILMSFLDAILYEGKGKIEDLEILNPYSAGAIFDLKDTYLDVRVKLKNNITVLIEMQLSNRSAFEKRVAYNACKTYANQLESGEKYYLLNPVIALTIMDFTLFEKSPAIINSFVFKEETQNFTYNQEIKLVFVELPKFNKKLEELETLTEKWLYFLKNAPLLREKPKTLETIPELDNALEIANLSGLTREQLEEIQRRQMFLTDQETITMYAKEIGMEIGIKMGRQEGRQEGIDLGIQKQKNLVLRQVKKIIPDITPELETKINNLSIESIELLGEELFDFKTLDDLINWLNYHS